MVQYNKLLIKQNLKFYSFNSKNRFLRSLTKAINDVLTANDNSIGNSGGTTDVKIKVHSMNNLYRFRFGSFVPEIQTIELDYSIISSATLIVKDLSYRLIKSVCFIHHPKCFHLLPSIHT